MQWGIESLAPVTGLSSAWQPTAAIADEPAADAAPTAFAQLMQRGLSEVGESVGAAETAMRDVAAGKPVELHEVMISLERANIGVQTFMQIRNKLVESYQDLMRMQM